MEYPSLLWQAGLDVEKRHFPVGDNGKLCPAPGPISTETIGDLLPAGAFCETSAAFFRFPCDRTEIQARQQCIWTLAHKENALQRIEDLLATLEGFERLLHRWQSPTQTQTARTLLFPAVAEAYLHVAKCFVAVSTEIPEVGVAVRDCFAAILQADAMVALAQAIEGYMSTWPAGVQIEIGSGSPMTSSVTGGYRAELQQLFAEMGIPEACPTVRSHLADSTMIEAYAAAYPDVLSHAAQLAETYATQLTDTYAMADVLLYRLELVFCREAALYTRRMEAMGYPMCLPAVATERRIHLRSLRDVSLAARELRGEDVVPNDVRLDGDRRFCYVTGANGGGKTTYLRSVGIAVLFFLTGCPVSALGGELWPFARLYTHFPSKEDFTDSGRFVDEVRRADAIRDGADGEAVALFNETFSGTDEEKSTAYSRALAEDMVDCGAFGLYVTHIHSLTHGRIPTLAAVVDEADENKRTYRIVPMDGTDSSFARDILQKYRLTEEGLAARLAERQNKREEAGLWAGSAY